MRIIAGEFRGRQLLSPPDRRTRPIIDRVKESLFGILASRFGDPPMLTGVSVLDVFAGTGSLGLEAVSRGAASCLFVERDPLVARLLERNLEHLEVRDRCTIIRADAFARGFAGREHGPAFDLVFIDPPFYDSRDLSAESPVGRLLAYAGEVLRPGGLLVLRHESVVEAAGAYGELRKEDRRDYARQAITFLARHG